MASIEGSMGRISCSTMNWNAFVIATSSLLSQSSRLSASTSPSHVTNSPSRRRTKCFNAVPSRTDTSWLRLLQLALWTVYLSTAVDAFETVAITAVNCDRDLVSSASRNGTFSSPGYPRPHPGDITCRYKFQGHGRERVQITFIDIDLNYAKTTTRDPKQTHELCDDVDSVTVSIFIDNLPRDIGVYCGNQRSAMLMSNDNRLEVTFISRSIQPTARGFQARFSFVEDFGIKAGRIATDMVCGFIFKSDEQPNGTFTSPNFPGLYPRNTECHYLFYGQGIERIYITFPYFDVEGVQPACNKESQSDYIEFSNFNVHLMDRKMYRLCGTRSAHAKNDVTSDGNFFRVTFKSNDAFDATGFEAFYQFRKSEDSFIWSHPKQTKKSDGDGDQSAASRLNRNYLPCNVVIIITLISALSAVDSTFCV